MRNSRHDVILATHLLIKVADNLIDQDADSTLLYNFLDEIELVPVHLTGKGYYEDDIYRYMKGVIGRFPFAVPVMDSLKNSNF